MIRLRHNTGGDLWVDEHGLIAEPASPGYTKIYWTAGARYMYVFDTPEEIKLLIDHEKLARERAMAKLVARVVGDIRKRKP